MSELELFLLDGIFFIFVRGDLRKVHLIFVTVLTVLVVVLLELTDVCLPAKIHGVDSIDKDVHRITRLVFVVSIVPLAVSSLLLSLF